MSKYPVNMREMISENIRKSIYKAGLELIQEEGWSSFKTENIAARVGVSRSVLYNYFKNKEDIARCIIETSMNEFTQKMEKLVKAPGTVESRLREMAKIMVEDFLSHRKLYGFFVENIQVSTSQKKKVSFFSWRDRRNEIFVNILNEGALSGEFVCDSIEASALLLMGGLHELCIKSLFTNCEFSVDSVIDVFLKGVKK